MTSSSATSLLPPLGGYRLWANSYDHEPNPMLSLERRFLEPLLPPLKGLDVADIGCGTGRWLQILRDMGARTLFGVDLSPEMLDQARAKLGGAATLWCGEYASAPISTASADLVFCNFVPSYVEEPLSLLSFAAKILRPGGSLFLSDVHPETASALNWRRGVRVNSDFQEIRTYNRSLEEISRVCRHAGFAVSVHLEPSFGNAERAIFEENGKAEYFDEIRNLPAIYLLQLTKPQTLEASEPLKSKSGMIAGIMGGRFALGPTEAAEGELRFSNGRIEMISHVVCHEAASAAARPCIDLTGYLALPGLINAHDHLEFALFPRLGRGGYSNFLEWADDIHRTHAVEIARHRQVPKRVRLWWGGIRNLLCGVTTVCHHNPYAPEVFSEDFIVRVLKDYGWAHSLRMEPGAAQKKNTTPAGERFFIHLAEGIDDQSAGEIFELCESGALDENTVIIHGLGMNESGRALLRSTGAGLIWCPSSNAFLFGKSMSCDEIQQFPKVALGSDSPLTAEGDLLDELRFAHKALQTPPAQTYDYVTRQGACLLGLKNGEGAFGCGGFADLLAVRDRNRTPAETLNGLSYRDVELVLLAGRVQLASPEIKRRLPVSAAKGLQPLAIESQVRWIRAPLDQLFAETVNHLPGPIYLGGRQVSLGS